jgi:phosphatidylserine/phosphatidylglycerophosphate/cardiolipin synthase-like enzyme
VNPRAVIILLVLVLLTACSISPRTRQSVDDHIEAGRQTELNCPQDNNRRCAIDSPLRRQGVTDTRNGTHHVTLIEVGEDALMARLHLARAAQDSIEVQNFILRPDATGSLLLQELLSAARRGVRVRLLLDQLFSLNDLDYLLQLTMAHVNFEVRFYNPVFNKARTSSGEWIGGVTCCFRNFNQRMHNKLWVIDDVVGITGGRNLADRYFDYDTQYNFKDRDVLAFGPLAAEMRESFTWFWDSDQSVPVQHLRDVARGLLKGELQAFPEHNLPDRLRDIVAASSDSARLKEQFLQPAYAVEKVRYYSDHPRSSNGDSKKEREGITSVLHQTLSRAEQSVVMQSPYMVLSRRARKLFKQLRKDQPGVELMFSTNSLASTDAYTAYAISYKHRKHYLQTLGFHIYEMKPFPDDAPLWIPRLSELIIEKSQGINSGDVPAVGFSPTLDMPGPRVGLHSKSFVVDGKVAMIGSHNFDPRSEGFNTENGLIIWDERFAADLEALIRKDATPRNSWVAASKPEVPVLSDVNDAIESVSRTLPIFDIWPIRSSTIYELRPGRQPVSPDHAEFHQRYIDVGSFPDVIATRRQVSTMTVSAFFGFLTPVM